MPHVISWNALDYFDHDFLMRGVDDLPMGDRIMLSRERSLPAEQVEFVFSTDPTVDWWKELMIRDAAGNVLGLLSAEGPGRQPSRIQFSFSEVTGAKLVLSKAMMFGVHTPVYEIQDLPIEGGVSYWFAWTKQ